MVKRKELKIGRTYLYNCSEYTEHGVGVLCLMSYLGEDKLGFDFSEYRFKLKDGGIIYFSTNLGKHFSLMWDIEDMCEFAKLFTNQGALCDADPEVGS